MNRTVASLIVLSCLFVGCKSHENATAITPSPTSQDLGDIIAELSLVKAATFVERRPKEHNRETLVFQYDGLSNSEYLSTFEKELARVGWAFKGVRSFKTSSGVLPQKENVYERGKVEISYWIFESYGQYMIGVTVPKQNDTEAKGLKAMR